MAGFELSGDFFSGLGGAASSLFGGIGQLKAAKGYTTAAGYARLSAQIADQAAAIKGVQAQREIYRVLGGQQADYAGAGLALSGSALDVIRDSTQQGALTRQLIAAQGDIEVMGYEAEAASYAAQAAASKAAGKGGILGGVLKAAGTIATAFALSDDRMKEGVALVERRRDGIGIYEFSYRGRKTRFRGVLASEVLRAYPEAVEFIDGYAHVNYAAIGVAPEVAIA